MLSRDFRDSLWIMAWMPHVWYYGCRKHIHNPWMAAVDSDSFTKKSNINAELCQGTPKHHKALIPDICLLSLSIRPLWPTVSLGLHTSVNDVIIWYFHVYFSRKHCVQQGVMWWTFTGYIPASSVAPDMKRCCNIKNVCGALGLIFVTPNAIHPLINARGKVKGTVIFHTRICSWWWYVDISQKCNNLTFCTKISCLR